MCVPTQHQANSKVVDRSCYPVTKPRGGWTRPFRAWTVGTTCVSQEYRRDQKGYPKSKGKNQKHMSNPLGSEKLRRHPQLRQVSRHKVEDLNDSEGVLFPSRSFLANGGIATIGAISFWIQAELTA